jgi:hypothetical protein
MNKEPLNSDASESSKVSWVKIGALSLGLPSTLVGLLFAFNLLYKEGILSKLQVFIIFLIVIMNFFYAVWKFSFSKKNQK